MTGPGRPRPSGDASLALIRISLLLGVLLFGAVSWFVHRDPSWQPRNPEALPALRRAMLVAWAVAIGTLIVLRPRLGRASGAARAPLLLIAWAIGEAAALFGAVNYFMSGDVLSFLGGLVVMLAALLLFPVRQG